MGFDDYIKEIVLGDVIMEKDESNKTENKEVIPDEKFSFAKLYDNITYIIQASILIAVGIFVMVTLYRIAF